MIMPFSETKESHTEAYWTSIFEDFLKPLIEENPNLEARRSEAIREDILRQIITDLVVSPIVVADLADLNPNVLWELGVRQSFKHGTITIAESGTILPFDISSRGTIFYDPEDRDKDDFRIRFKKAIADCLTNPDKPDSHVLEILYRGTLYEIFHRNQIIRRLDALISECNWNIEILNNIISFKHNINEEQSADYPIRLGIGTLELLITDRYVDEENSYYDLSERCLLNLRAINKSLDSWIYPLKDKQQRIVNGVEISKSNLLKLKQRTLTVKNKMTQQI